MDTTPPSIRKDLRDLYRHEWPEWWDCCRECSPGMAAVGVAAMAPLTAAYIAYSVWIKYSPWSDYRRGISREKSFRSFAFGQDELAGTMVADFEPLPRPGDAAMPKDGFFDALPYEIRTMILNLAFGEQTLHMDLQFRRPYEKTRIKGMHGELPVRKMKRDGQMAVEEQWSKKRSWIWYSCVCHRCPPNAHSCLSHGRIANHGLVPDLDPEQDTCLLGKACCSEWHGEEGKKCYVGVMGWLLTCKKAYVEGCSILYGRNTIHVSSEALVRTIPDVLPGHVLRNITSLVLVWPEKLRISGGFKSQKQRKEFEHSNWYQHTFPALVHLRICFKADSNGGHSLSMAPLPNSIGIQDDKSRRLAEGIWSNMFLKNVLHMVEKVCPPTTTVTITVPLWTWFEGFEESFIRTQGIDATKPQMAEIGGLKLWKVCSKRASKYGRAGFWVHTEVNNVKFFKREPHQDDDKKGYDWDRHHLYNLGDEKMVLWKHQNGHLD